MQYEDPLFSGVPADDNQVEEQSNQDPAHSIETSTTAERAGGEGTTPPAGASEQAADYKAMYEDLKGSFDKRMAAKDSDVDRRINVGIRNVLTPFFAEFQEFKNSLQKQQSQSRQVSADPDMEGDPDISKKAEEFIKSKSREALAEELGIDPKILREVALTSKTEKEVSQFFSERPEFNSDDGLGLFYKPALDVIRKHYQVDRRFLDVIGAAVAAQLQYLNDAATKRGLSGQPKVTEGASGAGSNGAGSGSPTQKSSQNLSPDQQQNARRRESASSVSQPVGAPLGRARQRATTTQDIVNFLHGIHTPPE